jgi:hypothetical protein
MVTSVRERAAQKARSFKLSDRFEQSLFFDNSLIALHSFSFTQQIKDHSSLLSIRSIYKSDLPSSVFVTAIFFQSLFCYSYCRYTFTSASKVTSHKEVTKL